MIRLSDLDFSYDPTRPVLHGLNFHLAPDEKIGLIGPNGSGKTSLFHLIVGLLHPSRGQVEIFDQVRRQETDFWEVRQRVGLLFQDADDQLFCPTVAEDIAFGPLNLGKEHAETTRIVRDTLALVGLQGFEERITYHLSGGEKRLVSLATVLAMAPDVLLLDEPTGGLHENAVARLEAILQDHVRACIIISHDRSFLERTTQKRYQMADGQIVPA